MPYPNKGESKSHYIGRCMADTEMNDKHPDKFERYAVCSSFWDKYDASKTSFDYDGVLSTNSGKNLAEKQQGTVYIISARSRKEGMLNTAAKLRIPESRVFATGSNKAKIEKIKELGITTHYDNNPDVIKELGSIGKLFR